MRKKLVDSDKLECVITLVGGVFYSTGVSACILLLNNKKPKKHIGRICMIDASKIYTPQRAQNIMTEDNVLEVYRLYESYEDVVEQAKIVTLEDVRKRDYSLAVNQYIERKEQEKVEPSEVRKEYFEALEEVYRAQERMRKLLIAGGYVSERQDNY